MPLRAHVRLNGISIALIVLQAIILIAVTRVSAAQQNNLPPLGNTAELDRVLSQEVSDDFVFGSDSVTQMPQSNGAIDERSADLSQQQPSSAQVAGTQNTAPNNAAPTTQGDPAGSAAGAAAMIGDASTYPTNYSAKDTNTWLPVYARDESQSGSVWDHIIASQRLPLADNKRVSFYKDQYLRDAIWISKILHRGSPYLAHLVATLDQRFMPLELALLPAIESGYQSDAKSAGNAAGLWQIVPITAKEIGIQRDVWFDGRRDILTSTTAAIDYLSYLNAEFNGDWELTLAAYNAGPGRVRAAIRKNKEAQLPTDFWSLDLPRETLNYVPKLVALVALIKSADHGGFDMPDIKMEPAFESIDVGFRISVDKAAEIADIDPELLQSLNAGLIHGVTAPDGPHYLLIPSGTGEQFQQSFSNIDKSMVFSEPKTHQVAAGDTISSIALKYGISQRQLLAMNSLDSTKIKIGQKLAVLDGRGLSDTAVDYVVTIGDTLSEIADEFSVNMRDITGANGESLDSQVIHPGDKLKITLPTPTSG